MLEKSNQTVASTKDILDRTSQSISGGAFQRQGKIIDTKEKSVTFSISINTTHTESTHMSVPESECPICNDTAPTKFESIVLQAPFAMTNSYDRIQEATHLKSNCMNCEGTGKLTCNNCYGNGKLICPECYSSGRVVSAEECPSCSEHSPSDSELLDCEHNEHTIIINDCTNCNDRGEVVCTNCIGKGNTNCPECMCAGKLHTYYKLEYKVDRDVTAHGIPAFWSGSAVEIATQFDWDQEDLEIINSSSRTVEIETIGNHVEFVSLEYHGDRYNYASFPKQNNFNAIWDSKTGPPKTSIQHKLVDLKFRMLGSA